MDKKEKGIFVSASALRDYLKCSQQVYYRIFEPELKIENREMIIGRIVHKVLEKAWKNKDVALGLGKSLCQKEKLDAVAEQSVEHFIHTFFESFSPIISDEDSVEKFFKVKLYDDVYLVGKFDRISRGMVIDWKTVSQPPKRIDNDIQFIIYDLAYNLLYGRQPEGLYLAALKDGSLIRYTESKNHSETLINQVIPNFVADVRNKVFVKFGLFTGACYRCPYKAQCLGTEVKNVMVFEQSIEE